MRAHLPLRIAQGQRDDGAFGPVEQPALLGEIQSAHGTTIDGEDFVAGPDPGLLRLLSRDSEDFAA